MAETGSHVVFLPVSGLLRADSTFLIVPVMLMLEVQLCIGQIFHRLDLGRFVGPALFLFLMLRVWFISCASGRLT